MAEHGPDIRFGSPISQRHDFNLILSPFIHRTGLRFVSLLSAATQDREITNLMILLHSHSTENCGALVTIE